MLTIAETAKRLGWHPDDVRRCIRNEQIPVIRVGRKLRVPAQWVADPKGWLADMVDTNELAVDTMDTKNQAVEQD